MSRSHGTWMTRAHSRSRSMPLPTRRTYPNRSGTVQDAKEIRPERADMTLTTISQVIAVGLQQPTEQQLQGTTKTPAKPDNKQQQIPLLICKVTTSTLAPTRLCQPARLQTLRLAQALLFLCRIQGDPHHLPHLRIKRKRQLHQWPSAPRDATNHGWSQGRQEMLNRIGPNSTSPRAPECCALGTQVPYVESLGNCTSDGGTQDASPWSEH